MRSVAWRAAATAVLWAALACKTVDYGTGVPPASSSDHDGAELTAVIDAVKEAIVQAETRDIKGFPALRSISVTLQTTVSRSAGGEVRYLVLAVRSGVSSDATSTLKLDMQPPEIPRLQTLVPKEALKDALAQAIQLAKIGVAQARKGEPSLEMKSVSIELKFAVAAEGSVGAGVKLLPIGLEGTGQISRERMHSVSLKFGS